MVDRRVKYKKVEEVPVWQQSHKLVLKVYKIVSNFPKSEVYGITSQLRRASSSIPANITEGFYRGTTKQLIQFLYIARASLGEVVYYLRLSRDLKYLKSKEYNHLTELSRDVGKQLNGWINSLKK